MRPLLVQTTHCVPRIAWLFMIGATLLSGPSMATAELGGDKASIEANRVSMHATLTIMTAQSAMVHEMVSPDGVTIREYTNPEGTVFAVSWTGPVLPNMRQLLGAYFDRYMEILSQMPFRAHTPVVLRQPEFVLESGGRMRSFVGRAYLPQKIPSGVSIDTLK